MVRGSEYLFRSVKEGFLLKNFYFIRKERFEMQLYGSNIWNPSGNPSHSSFNTQYENFLSSSNGYGNPESFLQSRIDLFKPYQNNNVIVRTNNLRRAQLEANRQSDNCLSSSGAVTVVAPPANKKSTRISSRTSSSARPPSLGTARSTVPQIKSTGSAPSKRASAVSTGTSSSSSLSASNP